MRKYTAPLNDAFSVFRTTLYLKMLSFQNIVESLETFLNVVCKDHTRKLSYEFIFIYLY